MESHSKGRHVHAPLRNFNVAVPKWFLLTPPKRNPSGKRLYHALWVESGPARTSCPTPHPEILKEWDIKRLCLAVFLQAGPDYSVLHRHASQIKAVRAHHWPAIWSDFTVNGNPRAHARTGQLTTVCYGKFSSPPPTDGTYTAIWCCCWLGPFSFSSQPLHTHFLRTSSLCFRCRVCSKEGGGGTVGWMDAKRKLSHFLTDVRGETRGNLISVSFERISLDDEPFSTFSPPPCQ